MEQEGKPRGEHRPTLSTAVLSDCISSPLLLLHLQPLQTGHFKQVGRGSRLSLTKASAFCLMAKINSKCGTFNTDHNLVTIQIFAACFPFCPSLPLCSPQVGLGASFSLSKDLLQLRVMQQEMSPSPALGVNPLYPNLHHRHLFG